MCTASEQKKETYMRMVERLISEMNPSPGKKLADFKKAALYCFATRFFHSKVSWCDFYLTQLLAQKSIKADQKLIREVTPNSV